MAPPKVDLESQKNEIITRYLSGEGAPELSVWLGVSRRTLQNRLGEWNVVKRPATTDTPDLRLQIWYLVYQCCLNDAEVVYALLEQGYVITRRSLERIRSEEGIVRRHCLTGEALKKSDEFLCQVVKFHLDKGSIEGFGRGHLHTYFRMHNYPVSR